VICTNFAPIEAQKCGLCINADAANGWPDDRSGVVISEAGGRGH